MFNEASETTEKNSYHKNSKSLDKQEWVKCADSDQTAPQEQSDQSLHCLLFRLHQFDLLLHENITKNKYLHSRAVMVICRVSQSLETFTVTYKIFNRNVP